MSNSFILAKYITLEMYYPYDPFLKNEVCLKAPGRFARLTIPIAICLVL